MTAIIATRLSAELKPDTPAALAHSTQMIVVVTTGWDAVQGRLERFERNEPQEDWRAVGEAIPIVVGDKGMGWGIGLVNAKAKNVRAASDPVKKEGDGKSPAGVFALGTAFGDATEPLAGIKLPYLELTRTVECVDDVSSKKYNRIVDRSSVAVDWNSSEHMRDVGEAYRWGVVIDHNGTVTGGAAPRPGGGSCVFLHIWHNAESGTAGCTAMNVDDLKALMRWLDPSRSPVMVQLPEAAYQRLARRWSLPSQPRLVGQ